MEVFVQETVSKLKRKKVLQKVQEKHVDVVVTYMLLCILGVKQGYLVDCFNFDVISLNTIANNLLESLGSKGKSLIIMILDSDNIIISQDTLSQKLHTLESNGFEGTAFAVDLSNEPPLIATEVEIRRISQQIVDIFTPLQNSRSCQSNISFVQEFTLSIDNCTFGFPFIAGWLIGYPIIYYSNPHSESFSLGMTPLMKYSLNLLLSTYQIKNNTFKNNNLCKSYDLLVFTCPRCILSDSIGNFIEEFMQCQSSTIENLLLDTFTFHSLTLKSEDIIVPSVSL